MGAKKIVQILVGKSGTRLRYLISTGYCSGNDKTAVSSVPQSVSEISNAPLLHPILRILKCYFCQPFGSFTSES